MAIAKRQKVNGRRTTTNRETYRPLYVYKRLLEHKEEPEQFNKLLNVKQEDEFYEWLYATLEYGISLDVIGTDNTQYTVFRDYGHYYLYSPTSNSTLPIYLRRIPLDLVNIGGVLTDHGLYLRVHIDILNTRIIFRITDKAIKSIIRFIHKYNKDLSTIPEKVIEKDKRYWYGQIPVYREYIASMLGVNAIHIDPKYFNKIDMKAVYKHLNNRSSTCANYSPNYYVTDNKRKYQYGTLRPYRSEDVQTGMFKTKCLAFENDEDKTRWFKCKQTEIILVNMQLENGNLVYTILDMYNPSDLYNAKGLKLGLMWNNAEYYILDGEWDTDDVNMGKTIINYYKKEIRKIGKRLNIRY